MNTIGTESPVDIVSFINNKSDISWNLSPDELEKATIDMNMGKLTNTGALAINTGKFTGRAPKDRFIVKDTINNNIASIITMIVFHLKWVSRRFVISRKMQHIGRSVEKDYSLTSQTHF